MTDEENGPAGADRGGAGPEQPPPPSRRSFVFGSAALGAAGALTCACLTSGIR
ncbi:MAG TPA: twin-arginine translocation signal domain-containing protein [Streptosporangiaceae bacterium]